MGGGSGAGEDGVAYRKGGEREGEKERWRGAVEVLGDGKAGHQ